MSVNHVNGKRVQFGMIFHYRNVHEVMDGYADRLGFIGSSLRRLPIDWVKAGVANIGPFKWFTCDDFVSPAGRTVRGFVVTCPFFPEQILTEGKDRITEKVINAVRLAERNGAALVGLAGFTSIVSDEGERVSEVVQVPVTTGNTYAAALAIQGIEKAARLMGVRLEYATAAVIGATGDIGSACSRVLSRRVKRLKLAARNDKVVAEFGKTLGGSAEVTVNRYVREAIEDADIVLTATSSLTTLIEADDVREGAIICDVAIPYNVASDVVKKRPDVLAFQGGWARLPAPLTSSHQDWMRFCRDGGREVFGCFAETLLLALDGRFECFSHGRGRIMPEQIEEIWALGTKHGFDVGGFSYGERRFSDQEVLEIGRNRNARSGNTTNRKV